MIHSEFTTQKPVVLVVDDMPANVSIYKHCLKDDYRVKVATNGTAAIKASLLPPYPELILLDVMMPNMDGYEVCRRLKKNINTRDIPVIFVTSKSEAHDEVKGFDYGAVDFITKPIQPVILKARMKSHLVNNINRHREERKVNQSLSTVVDTIGDMLSAMTSDTLSSVKAHDHSMKSLLEDNAMTGEWALRLASMLQGSVNDGFDMADSSANVSRRAFNDVSGKMKQIPFSSRGEELFGSQPEPGSVDQVESTIGQVFLQAAAIKARDISDPGLGKAAQKYIARFMKELTPAASMKPKKPADMQGRSTLDSLKPGMVLPDGVKTCQGLAILPAGVRLTESMISYLFQVRSNSTLIQEPVNVAC